MKQYLDLLRKIKEEGVLKEAARENMPGTLSIFGYQFRHNLQEGFPLLTTKKLSFKNIVVELLWFLKGDTNIKYLVDNGCNIWNEDAYNYYLKCCKNLNITDTNASLPSFEEFILYIKNSPFEYLKRVTGPLKESGYVFGDCGKQYGWLWRSWNRDMGPIERVDQLLELIKGIRNNPLGRRHIITAWNPATLDDMALNACHAFVQFNCRPLGLGQREVLFVGENCDNEGLSSDKELHNILDREGVPRYYLDCQMYQRSADAFLGVPYNIASYALLTQIIAQIVGMLPGDFIHTFGDVHIYENHLDQVDEQLGRDLGALPMLKFNNKFERHLIEYTIGDVWSFSEFIETLEPGWFEVENYNPHPPIKAKLSTGLR